MQISKALNREVLIFDNDGVFTSRREHRIIMMQMVSAFRALCKEVGVTSHHKQWLIWQQLKKYIKKQTLGDGTVRVGALSYYFHNVHGLPVERIEQLMIGALQFKGLRPFQPQSVRQLEHLCHTKRVMVFTNSYKSQVLNVWRKKGIAHLIEQNLVQVYDITTTMTRDGVFPKPHPKAYQLMLHASGLKAEQCAFFDDKLENVTAAEALGFASVHIHKEKGTPLMAVLGHSEKLK